MGQKSENIPDIVSKVLVSDDKTVLAAFPKKGRKLIDFLGQIDISHPDLHMLPLGQNSESLCQILDLVKHATDNKLDLAINLINDASHLLGDIEDPMLTGRQIRLLPDHQRCRARTTKNSFSFSSSAFYKFCSKNWSGPSDFSLFDRNADHGSFLSRHKEISEKFKMIGCDALAAAADRTADLARNPPDRHGFRRITVEQAMCVMAKNHNLLLSKDSRKRSLVFINTSKGSHLYTPTAHSLDRLAQFIPQRVREIIDGLESNRAVFDNHLVLVPSFGSNIKTETKHSLVHFESKLTDEEIVTSRDFRPVVLGERDGFCYFICMWF